MLSLLSIRHSTTRWRRAIAAAHVEIHPSRTVRIANAPLTALGTGHDLPGLIDPVEHLNRGGWSQFELSLLQDRSVPRTRKALVFAVGHFPPPVHGMAVATERLAALMSREAEVVRLDIADRASRRGLRHHLARSARTTIAAVTLGHRGRPDDAVLVGCDAGLGMVYTIAVVAVGRLRRCNLALHHHSFAYAQRMNRLMSVIVRIAGPRATHIVLCEAHAAAMRSHYARIGPIRVLPIAFVLPETLEADHSPLMRPIVLGHLSNLGTAKGLPILFRTLDCLSAAGIDARLRVAGPIRAQRDRAILLEELQRAGRLASYFGEVTDAQKGAFFRGMDAFLFPTQYRHELSPIVVAEAMAHGVPVIAYHAGCIDSSLLAGGGLVIDRDQDFARRASDQIRCWADDPSSHEAAADAAKREAAAANRAGKAIVHALAHELLSPGS